MTNSRQIRRQALEDAHFAAQRVQTAFLTEDVNGIDDLPDPNDKIAWLLRMANEMRGAILAMIEEEQMKTFRELSEELEKNLIII